MATHASDSEKSDGMSSNDVEGETLHPVETNSVRPACFSSTIQEVLCVLTATMAIGMSAWLSGSVIVLSSFVGRDLDMSQAQITWIASSSSLTSGAFLLFFGRVADLFGRKTLVVGSFLLFAIVCLGSGFSNTGITLDVLNGVLGLFSASAIPSAQGILGIAYGKPSRRKNAAFACFSAGNPLGFVFGIFAGGVTTSILNWRASYWFLAIIMFIFAIIGLFTIPKDHTDKQPLTWQTIKGFDIVGTMLTVAGIGMFSAALSLGSTAPQGWQTGYVLGMLIGGIACMIAFVFWEMWFKDPIMPMDIWKDRNFTLCLSIMMLGFTAFAPAAFWAALYFQRVWNFSALMTAVHVLPMAVSGILVNVIAALVLHRISNKLLMYIGAAAYAIAFLLFAMNRTSSSYWAFYFPGFAIQVIGADLEFNVSNMYVMSSMPSWRQSTAGSIYQTGAKLSMTLGFGITTALYDAVSKSSGLASYWDVAVQPYAVTFWFAFACSALSLFLVPFLTIGTQGGREKPREAEEASPVAKIEDM